MVDSTRRQHQIRDREDETITTERQGALGPPNTNLKRLRKRDIDIVFGQMTTYWVRFVESVLSMCLFYCVFLELVFALQWSDLQIGRDNGERIRQRHTKFVGVAFESNSRDVDGINSFLVWFSTHTIIYNKIFTLAGWRHTQKQHCWTNMHRLFFFSFSDG